MARTDNLTNFLTDVSAAIKQQTGDDTPIPAADFDTEILSIETVGTYQTKSMTVTGNNQTYQILPDQNYDALNEVNVTVNVPVEDLRQVITTQDEKLATLEAIIDTKAKGSVGLPNIYVQDNEPANKDGIWLKMSNTTAEHYVSDDNVFTGGTWAIAADTANVPYQFYGGAATSVGTDIYIFGGAQSGTNANAYKYNTLNDTYTQLTNIPYDFYRGCAVTIGTDIYLLGGQANPQYTYKYDTLTNTWTKKANVPYQFYYGSAASVGTDIYIFGGMNNATMARKYNTSTDTWTQLTNASSFAYGSAASVGTDIYLFGGTYQSSYMYKYNTLNNTYTQLSNIPYQFNQGSVATIGVDIHLLGSYNSKTSHRAYHAESKSYSTDNTVVIAQGRTYSVGYNVKLFNTGFESNYQPLYGFADAWFYTTQDGLDGTMPVYYGNGTNWINIKNPPVEEVEE